MLSIDVKAVGSDALKQKFDDLKKRASKEQVIHALVVGGHVLKEAVVQRTPVRSGVSGDAAAPGALKADVHVKVIKSEREPTVLVGPGAETALDMARLEFGHWEVSRKGVVGKFVAAHPVMSAAFEAAGEIALDAAIDALAAALVA